MRTNYCFDVNRDIKKLIIECLEELKKLNFPVPTSVYFREGGGLNTYGMCYEAKYYKKYLYWDFVISINKYLSTIKDFKETIIHELLHTIDLSHKGKWKVWAEYINQNTNYNITRCCNRKLKKNTFCGQKRNKADKKSDLIIVFCPICKDCILISKTSYLSKSGASEYYCKKCNMNYYKYLPDSPLKHYTDTQKIDFINLLMNGDNFQGNTILNALPYLNQDQRNMLILELFLKKTELFLSYKDKKNIVYPILSTCDKRIKTSLANMYINNQVERLKILTIQEFVEFSGIFSFTNDFIRVKEHYISLCDNENNNV